MLNLLGLINDKARYEKPFARHNGIPKAILHLNIQPCPFRRLILVGLLPKASTKANGNS